MAESTKLTKKQSDPFSNITEYLADENNLLRTKLRRQKRRKNFPMVGKELRLESWKVKDLLHILSLIVNNLKLL